MNIKHALATIAASSGLILAVQAIKAKEQLGSQIYEPEPEEIDIEEGNLKIAFLGDSLAVGLGADRYIDTPGYIVSKRLGAVYRNFAVSGSVSNDLHRQVLLALEFKPDIAVIIIGTNDITHGKSMRKGIKYLCNAIETLKDAGAVVFFIGCVDLEIVAAIGNPLRFILGGISRQYCRLQEWHATRLGAFVISSKPIYKAFDRKVMFAVDRFHPSSSGYRLIAGHVLQSIKDKTDIV